jgi:hypothetical protein
MRPPEPGRMPVRLVEWAAGTLPAAHRGRYLREFTAELYGLTPSHQLRHATQVLSRSWALRAALGEAVPATDGDGIMWIDPRRLLLCLLLGRHKWQIISTDDGTDRYNKCRRCGKEQSPPDGRSGLMGLISS